MQRRMTGGTARVRRHVLDVERVGDLLRARRGEGGRRALRVKILQRPDEELILSLSAATVAAGAGAGIRAQKFRRRVRAANRAGRQKNRGDKAGGWATNCFTHGDKLVNGVAA